MSLMRQLRWTINADAIAKGVLAMMRERHLVTDDAEDDETLIRFGMLPKRWMDMIEQSVTAVICERHSVTSHEKVTGIVMTVIKTGDGDDDYEVMTFKLSELISEMVHEVSLALYSNVEMVV